MTGYADAFPHQACLKHWKPLVIIPTGMSHLSLKYVCFCSTPLTTTFFPNKLCTTLASCISLIFEGSKLSSISALYFIASQVDPDAAYREENCGERGSVKYVALPCSSCQGGLQ